jgi:hypothetical protein
MAIVGLGFVLIFAVAAVSAGLPLLATAVFFLMPRLRRYRKPAVAGWVGSVLGALACGICVGVPLLFAGGDSSPVGDGVGFVVGATTGFGLLVGLPAMSFLGYMAGFFRTLRRLPPEASGFPP